MSQSPPSISFPRLKPGLAAALFCCCATAAAQTLYPPQETVHFGTFENDVLFQTDRYYTNGLQLSTKYSRDQRGDFALNLTRRACAWLGCEQSVLLTSQTNYGQLMYTPTDITVREPQPHDRPWAGLLYVEQSYSFLSPDYRTLTILTGQAGVTGPASLSEQAQKIFHRVFDQKPPQGWDNQIGGSLAVMASAERRTAIDGLSAELGNEVQLKTAGYWRIAAGNIMTYAAGGIAVVIGKDLPDVSPPPPGIGNKLSQGFGPTTCMVKWLQCSAFGIIETRLMARNVFLDGRLFRDDPKVNRRNLVSDLMVGLRLDFPDTRSASHGPWFVQLKITRRTPEFRSSIHVPRHRVAAVTIGTEF
jgi:lipid A 3-O-deacylase